jgi:CSLREA domain-containing protein
VGGLAPVRLLVAFAAALTLTLWSLPAAAEAADIAVTTVDDVSSPTDGLCSLREAVAAANSNTASGGVQGECAAGGGTPDTVMVPAGSYLLGGGVTIDTAHGDLTIAGAGSSNTTISQTAHPALLFRVSAGAANVVIADVALQDGDAPAGAPGAGGGEGGAVYNDQASLTVRRCVFAGNHARAGANGPDMVLNYGSTAMVPGSHGGNGGAIFNAGGTLVVEDSVFTGNYAGDGGHGGTLTGGNGPYGTSAPGLAGDDATGGAGGQGGQGGAIYSSGSLTVERSVFTSNHAGVGGHGGDGHGGMGGKGGGFQPGGAGGQGWAGKGGVGGDGGAIMVTGAALMVHDSTFTANSAGDAGPNGTGFGGTGGQGGDGGIGTGAVGGVGGKGRGVTDAARGGSGGAIYGDSTTSIASTTLTSNTAGAGGRGTNGVGGTGGAGGAAATTGSGGQGGDGWSYGGGPGGGGGAIVLGTATLTNLTITQNASGNGGDGGSGTPGSGGSGGTTGAAGASTAGGGNNGGVGGGISAGPGATIEHVTASANSTGAGGQPGTGGSASAGPQGSGGAFYTGGVVRNSIAASNTPDNCAGSPTGGNNVSFPDATCTGTNADPKLDPLADNGGPTQTQALGAGSAALDVVPATGAACALVDQRGVTRPRLAACDAGAYETAPPAVTTGGASAVDLAGATISGSVNPSFRSTSYHFEYGTTSAYGSSTSSADAGSDNSAHTVTASLTGLAAATTYHYRLVAANSEGSTGGVDQTFTTATAPSTGGGDSGGGGSAGTTAPSGGGTEAQTPPPDTTAPLISAAAISPATLKRRAGLRFTLSEPARVVVAIERARGRKFVLVVRMRLNGVAGRNVANLARRLSGKRLKAGRYRATIVATDAAGNRSLPKRIKFRVA